MSASHGRAIESPPHTVTIEVPEVPYPGGSTTPEFFRRAARNLRSRESVGGSNLRATIATLLERTAHAIDGGVPMPPSTDLSRAPDGRYVIEELTYADRQALPAVYHQPVWCDLATPATWICSVCWDDGVTHGWPCGPAARDGRPIADYAGLEATR